MASVGICTIISKNYLAYARVLAESFLRYNQGQVFVLLTDNIDGYFDPEKEKFRLIEIDDIKDKVADFERFSFQYNLTELNTAIKPFFLEFLLKKQKLVKLIFFDPDILITNNLNSLFRLLDKYSIVLIPHITQPFKDVHKPNEIDILKSGVYNLGFIALSNRNSTNVLLEWWKERLSRFCKSDVQKGLFVDQKWIDLIPGFFKDVFILRDPSYNVAYWNYHYREVSVDGRRILVNGKSAHFLHFSGFNPEDIESVSKHQDRFTLSDLRQIKPIFQLYKNELVADGYSISKSWPCKFSYFDNGVKIPDIARKIYWEIDEPNKSRFGNPFNSSGPRSYFNWLNKNIDTKIPSITNLMYEIYKRRIDVQRAYLDILGSDRCAFISWFSISAAQEYDLSGLFLEKAVPLNIKSKKEQWPSLKLKTIYKVRNIVKRCIRYLVGNDLRTISKLRMMEMRLHKKISGFSQLLTKRVGYTQGVNGKKGLNVLGYLTSEHGVGEAVRSNIRCLKSAGIDFALINYNNHLYSRQLDYSFTDFSVENPYYINLLHVNADMFHRLYLEKGESYFKDRYNIGFWTWELSDFPDIWLNSIRFTNEIWVPSNFVLAAIAKKSPVPVLRVPHAVVVDGIKEVNRSYFQLKDDELIFLFVFDFLSYFERKNPLAIINAFKGAFSATENVRLVIKCANSSWDPQAMDSMKEAAKGLKVDIIEQYLYRDEVNALISLADAYISLHRSEGFGLTMAEAMFLGKPVIATGFSGNTDFMNINNSFLVKYKLIPLDKDIGPYKRGCLWADPDIGHAAELMRSVYENRELAKEVGRGASLDIKKNFSPQTIGKEIKNRLEHIYNP